MKTDSNPSLHGLVIKPISIPEDPFLLVSSCSMVMGFSLYVQSPGLRLERLSWVNRSRAQHQLSIYVEMRSQPEVLYSNWETFNTFQRTLWPTPLPFLLERLWGWCEPSNLYLFFKVVWAILGPLHFYIYFEPFFFFVH